MATDGEGFPENEDLGEKIPEDHLWIEPALEEAEDTVEEEELFEATRMEDFKQIMSKGKIEEAEDTQYNAAAQ